MEGVWIRGGSRTGKTATLVEQLVDWVGTQDLAAVNRPGMLLLAANNSNQRVLIDRVNQALGGQYNFVSKTPLGFMADEVELFFPLLCDRLGMEPHFPLRLRPEMEQLMARELWSEPLSDTGLVWNERALDQVVRRLLDLLLLAGAGGVPLCQIPERLAQGRLSFLSGAIALSEGDRLIEMANLAGVLIKQWWHWCLEKGFLTYGMIYGLFGQYLLADAWYQKSIQSRFRAVFADDVQDYPAIARDACEQLLNGGAQGVFTEHPGGCVRLGLGADPAYWQGLSERCQIQVLGQSAGLRDTLMAPISACLEGSQGLTPLPPHQIQRIETISRSQLLDRVVAEIRLLVETKGVSPEAIAIIVPGLDEVARYTLMESLAPFQIPLQPLQEQRPINSSPWGRSILTLLALIFPGGGHFIETQDVAEMLTMLSLDPEGTPLIDPVRAGLLADYCFVADPERPHLLSTQTMARRDRLGYQGSKAYADIRQWILNSQQCDSFSPDGILQVLIRAMQEFYLEKLPSHHSQLTALRELAETAQHFWQCGDRRDNNISLIDQFKTFLRLIQAETITANPRPQNILYLMPPDAVTLATILQYRMARSDHRYQFWLDSGSRFWAQEQATRFFGYQLFQKVPPVEPPPLAPTTGDREHLKETLWDLIARTDEKIYLCHSHFSTTGNEQTGPLYGLLQSCQETVPIPASRTE